MRGWVSFRPGFDERITVSGIKREVRIQDIIDVHGERVPSVADAPKHFKLGFVLVSQGQPAPEDIARADLLRTTFESYFAQGTAPYGSVDTCLQGRAIDVVFVLDNSWSFFDDLEIFKSAIGGLVDNIATSTSPETRFALATFKDFPIAPYGCDGTQEVVIGDTTYCVEKNEPDYAYLLRQPLTSHIPTFLNAVANVDPPDVLDGGDANQSQYEAIYQVLKGTGKQLGLPGGLGDIQPSNIYTSEAERENTTRPLFILLFTDAPFHDSDIEPNYPGVGRNEVLALLQNTPFVFGFAPEDGVAGPDWDQSQLIELTTLTGGAVFDLPEDSFGFEQYVEQAVEETELPPRHATLNVLHELTIEQAKVRWPDECEEPEETDKEEQDPGGSHKKKKHRGYGPHKPFIPGYGPHYHGWKPGHHHSGHGHRHSSSPKPPSQGHPSRHCEEKGTIHAKGTLVLPMDRIRDSLGFTGALWTDLSESRDLVSNRLEFEAVGHGGRTWTSTVTDGPNDTKFTLHWITQTKAKFTLDATFDPDQIRHSHFSDAADVSELLGDVRPADLRLAIAIGSPSLTGSAIVVEPEWTYLDSYEWRLDEDKHPHVPHFKPRSHRNTHWYTNTHSSPNRHSKPMICSAPAVIPNGGYGLSIGAVLLLAGVLVRRVRRLDT